MSKMLLDLGIYIVVAVGCELAYFLARMFGYRSSKYFLLSTLWSGVIVLFIASMPSDRVATIPEVAPLAVVICIQFVLNFSQRFEKRGLVRRD